MLLIAGLFLLGLGLFSGAFLVLIPLGMVGGTAGLTLWILFPAFTIAGYLMAAIPSEKTALPLLSRITGALLVLLALASAAALVLQGSSVIESRGESFSLWYVLCVGLVLGAAGLASHRKDAAA
jgi:magnesium-transporting ATPase (P-type)